VRLTLDRWNDFKAVKHAATRDRALTLGATSFAAILIAMALAPPTGAVTAKVAASWHFSHSAVSANSAVTFAFQSQVRQATPISSYSGSLAQQRFGSQW
jgi:hypothetical protein